MLYEPSTIYQQLERFASEGKQNILAVYQAKANEELQRRAREDASFQKFMTLRAMMRDEDKYRRLVEQSDAFRTAIPIAYEALTKEKWPAGVEKNEEVAALFFKTKMDKQLANIRSRSGGGGGGGLNPNFDDAYKLWQWKQGILNPDLLNYVNRFATDALPAPAEFNAKLRQGEGLFTLDEVSRAKDIYTAYYQGYTGRRVPAFYEQRYSAVDRSEITGADGAVDAAAYARKRNELIGLLNTVPDDDKPIIYKVLSDLDIKAAETDRDIKAAMERSDLQDAAANGWLDNIGIPADLAAESPRRTFFVPSLNRHVTARQLLDAGVGGGLDGVPSVAEPSPTSPGYAIGRRIRGVARGLTRGRRQPETPVQDGGQPADEGQTVQTMRSLMEQAVSGSPVDKQRARQELREMRRRIGPPSFDRLWRLAGGTE